MRRCRRLSYAKHLTNKNQVENRKKRKRHTKVLFYEWKKGALHLKIKVSSAVIFLHLSKTIFITKKKLGNVISEQKILTYIEALSNKTIELNIEYQTSDVTPPPVPLHKNPGEKMSKDSLLIAFCRSAESFSVSLDAFILPVPSNSETPSFFFSLSRFFFYPGCCLSRR